jgi:hypothetical protein
MATADAFRGLAEIDYSAYAPDIATDKFQGAFPTFRTFVPPGGTQRDEFVILLPQTDKHSALVVAKRIQDMMRKTVFLAEDGLNLNVRCSMGLATYPEDAKSSHEIIRQADEMMYMVKNSTRDNIAVAQQGILK